MKKPLEAAAELFRANESLAEGDQEKENLYRGLIFLAEGLRRLEKEIEKISEGDPAALNRRSRFLRRLPPPRATRSVQIMRTE